MSKPVEGDFPPSSGVGWTVGSGVGGISVGGSAEIGVEVTINGVTVGVAYTSTVGVGSARVGKGPGAGRSEELML